MRDTLASSTVSENPTSLRYLGGREGGEREEGEGEEGEREEGEGEEGEREEREGEGWPVRN